MSVTTTARSKADVVIKIHKHTSILQSIHGDNLRLQKSNYFYITALFQALFLTGYNLHIFHYVYILTEYLKKSSLDKIYYVLKIIPAMALPSYILRSASSDHRRKKNKKKEKKNLKLLW